MPKGDAVMSASVRVRKPPGPMTVEEFLDWPEDPTGALWQLVEGEAVMMAPAAPLHGNIQNNLSFILTAHLRAARPGCHSVTSPGIQPRVRAKLNLRIPDVAVHCSISDRGEPVMTAPILAIEILSVSNRAETWSNVWTYCTIPTLREIMVIHAASRIAEVLTRAEDGSWPESFERSGALVTLASIGLTFPLADAYIGTVLADG